MAKSKTQVKEELQEKTLAVINAQKDLEKSEAFKQFMKEQKKVADLIADLKTTLKKEMVKQGIDEIISPDGPSDWVVKVIHKTTVKVSDTKAIPEEYLEEKELGENEIVVHDGKVFQLIPNTTLAKNNMAFGVKIPGFELQDIPAITIKVEGKAV